MMKSSMGFLAGLAAALLAVAGFTGAAAQQSSTAPTPTKVGEPFMPLPTLRIKPLDASKWTIAHQEMLGKPNMGMVGICAHNPGVCKTWWDFSQQLLRRNTLSLRDRELLILRTAYLCNSDFVWNSHARMSPSSGFTELSGLSAETIKNPTTGVTKDEVARIVEGPDAKGWNAFDAALLRAADELHRSQFIKDATWKTLAERYSDAQMLEVLFLVGDYHIYAMFHNSVGIQPPPGGALVPR